MGERVEPNWQSSFEWSEEAPSNRPRAASPYIDWAWSVVCWDGVLPFLMVAIPTAAKTLLPRNEGLSVAINVFLPIFAFFIRLAAGNERFDKGSQYVWQRVVFLIAVFFLIFLDTMLILFHSQLGGISLDDWIVLGVLYLIYLAAMAVAFFPLRLALSGIREAG
jgi:hypothetical protein